MKSAQLFIVAFFVNVSGFAQTTAWLRDGSPIADVRISTASNNGVSPLVVTTEYPHQFTGGEDIWFANVCGTTILNSTHYKVKSSSPAPTATTFAVVTAGGSDITSNGDFVLCASNAYVAKVAQYTLQDLPHTIFNGPHGSRLMDIALDSTSGLAGLSVTSNVATVTTSYPHGRTTGNKVGVWGTSSSALNGKAYTVTVTSSTTYTFPTSGVADGSYTGADTVVSAYGWPGNEWWDYLVAQLNLGWGSSIPMGSAIRWRIDRTQTTYRDLVLNLLLNYPGASYVYSFPCDETQDGCGNVETDVWSYTNLSTGWMYEIMRPYIMANWTSGQRQTLYDRLFNDLDDGCTKPLPTVQAGTISTDPAGTTVTGVGTHFTSLQAGLVVMCCSISGQGMDPFQRAAGNIVTITDDTHMTVSQTLGANLSGQPFWTMPSFLSDSHTCGSQWFVSHHGNAFVGNPTWYPTVGAAGSYYDAENKIGTKAYGYLGLALAFSNDDPRAVKLLENAWNWYYDAQFRFYSNYHTGDPTSGGNYGFARNNPEWAWNMHMMDNAVLNYPDLGTQIPGILRQGTFLMYDLLPDASNSGGDCTNWVGPNGPCPMATAAVRSDPINSGQRDAIIGSIAHWYAGKTAIGPYFTDWLKNGYQYAQGRFPSFLYFMANDPNIVPTDYRTLPKQYLFRSTGYALCAAEHGSNQLKPQNCVPDLETGLWLSRSGWGSSDTLVGVMGIDYASTDHQNPQAGQVQIYKKAKLLSDDIGGNNGQVAGEGEGWDETVQDQLFSIGIYGMQWFANQVNPQQEAVVWSGGVPTTYPAGTWNNPNITRWAGVDPTGPASGDYTYGLVDLSKAIFFQSNISKANREVAHLKKPATEEIVVIHDYVSLTTPNSIAGHLHFPQAGGAGQGTTVCPSDAPCASLNTNKAILEQSGASNLIAKWIDPTGGNLRVYTETGTLHGVANQTGGYPGGWGYSFRVSYCTTADGGATCDTNATSMESLVVLKPTADTADTSLTATSVAPDANWAGVQTTDKVAVFSRGGTTHSTMTPFVTTHSGTAQYLFAGVAPGSYGVTVNGVQVSMTPFVVTNGDTTIEFESTAGIVALGAPPTAVGGSKITGQVGTAGKVVIY